MAVWRLMGRAERVLVTPAGPDHNAPFLGKGHIMAEAISTVTYRDVPGFPGYRVGDDGSVWSCRPPNGRGGLISTWRQLRSQVNKGYVRVALKVGRRNHWRFVHSLLLELFVGPCPVGMECCHYDGDRTNNRLDNLRWGTRKENAADTVRLGRLCKGSLHGRSKLTEGDISRIRGLVAGGRTCQSVAEEYGVGRRTVSDVIHGYTWGHIPVTPAMC